MCFMDNSRYERKLTEAVDMKLLFSLNFDVKNKHLEALTRACGDARQARELNHHLNYHPTDPAYSEGMDQPVVSIQRLPHPPW